MPIIQTKQDKPLKTQIDEFAKPRGNFLDADEYEDDRADTRNVCYDLHTPINEATKIAEKRLAEEADERHYRYESKHCSEL